MLLERGFDIEQLDGEVQLSLYQNGVQVGGALFPDDDGRFALAMAHDLASGWMSSAPATLLH